MARVEAKKILRVKKGFLGHVKELTFYLDDKRRPCRILNLGIIR